jgi:hypothetical protein
VRPQTPPQTPPSPQENGANLPTHIASRGLHAPRARRRRLARSLRRAAARVVQPCRTTATAQQAPRGRHVWWVWWVFGAGCAPRWLARSAAAPTGPRSASRQTQSATEHTGFTSVDCAANAVRQLASCPLCLRLLACVGVCPSSLFLATPACELPEDLFRPMEEPAPGLVACSPPPERHTPRHRVFNLRKGKGAGRSLPNLPILLELT